MHNYLFFKLWILKFFLPKFKLNYNSKSPSFERKKNSLRRKKSHFRISQIQWQIVPSVWLSSQMIVYWDATNVHAIQWKIWHDQRKHGEKKDVSEARNDTMKSNHADIYFLCHTSNILHTLIPSLHWVLFNYVAKEVEKSKLKWSLTHLQGSNSSQILKRQGTLATRSCKHSPTYFVWLIL